jgi:hypothetical protein
MRDLLASARTVRVWSCDGLGHGRWCGVSRRSWSASGHLHAPGRSRLLDYFHTERLVRRPPCAQKRPPCAQLSTLMTLIRKSERAAAPR